MGWREEGIVCEERDRRHPSTRLCAKPPPVSPRRALRPPPREPEHSLVLSSRTHPRPAR